MTGSQLIGDGVTHAIDAGAIATDGWYRIRCTAVGRAWRSRATLDVGERYLLEVWPAGRGSHAQRGVAIRPLEVPAVVPAEPPADAMSGSYAVMVDVDEPGNVTNVFEGGTGDVDVIGFTVFSASDGTPLAPLPRHPGLMDPDNMPPPVMATEVLGPSHPRGLRAGARE